MYRCEFLDELKRRGHEVPPWKIQCAINTGRMEPPKLDGIGCGVYEAKHVEQFVDYLANPPRRGKRNRAECLALQEKGKK